MAVGHNLDCKPQLFGAKAYAYIRIYRKNNTDVNSTNNRARCQVLHTYNKNSGPLQIRMVINGTIYKMSPKICIRPLDILGN